MWRWLRAWWLHARGRKLCSWCWKPIPAPALRCWRCHKYLCPELDTPPEPLKACSWCHEAIRASATRCPHCTGVVS